MTRSGGPDRKALFEVADGRRGVFTAAEARAAGFTGSLLSHSVGRGEFARVGHGVYRLVAYPTSPEDRIVEVAAMLGPSAVVSHETALATYGVCDVSPSRVQITLPRAKRYLHQNREIPDAELHTVAGTIDERDIVQAHGYRKTSLARSILDSARLGTDPKQVEMAIANGRRSGQLHDSDLRRVFTDAPARLHAFISEVPSMPRYANPRAFESALVVKLRENETRSRTVTDMRKEIAFDRVLARLQIAAPESWLLKGGVALDFRFRAQARTTLDIDVSSRLSIEEMTEALQRAEQVKLDDYFTIKVGECEQPIDEIDTFRFNVSVNYSDGREFAKNLKIDVGFADPWLGEPEPVTAPPYLEFAGIPPTTVQAVPVEQHIAEKIHAFSRDYGGRESSRVKDLVDMVLMVDHRPIDAAKLAETIHDVFAARGTHAVPTHLPAPPPSWKVPYERLAAGLPIPQDLAGAYRHVARALNPALDREHGLER